MKEIAKMRLAVLREIKNVKIFLAAMERSAKERDQDGIQQAYMFLIHLCYHMNEGCLIPDSIALDLDLSCAYRDKMESLDE